jgi:fatty-acyl-CoA synthase
MFVPLTPVRFLYRAVDLFGKKVGIVSGGQQFTYAEFGRRCERLAAGLIHLGIQPGDRVAFLSFNNHQLLESYYGVPMAKAIVMPLNVRLSPAELVSILNHSAAKVLFLETEFMPLSEQFRSSCPQIQRIITLDNEYEQLLDAAEPKRADIMAYDENAIAELFYTSGSTGTPKGVMLGNRTLYLHGLDVALCYIDPDTAVDLHTIPLFHANGWGRAHSSTLLGIKQVMVRRFEPTAVFKLIEEHRATDMSLVPTMANALLNAPDKDQHDLSSLRQVMIGGAASSRELIARMEETFKIRCFAGYGLTESGPVITSARHKSTVSYANEQERAERQAMAGWPLVGAELRVVDLQMNDVPRDMKSIGEVIARGDHIMEGYFADDQATAAVMSDGWLHTGDMGVWDEERYIHIVDRKKEIIISGGENISSIEVEKAIFAHPEVFECAVIAAPDDKWGEVPVAIVVRKPGSAVTADQICRFIEGRIGKFKMPRQIEFSDEPLPKTGTGKIRKLVLREKYWAGKARRVQGG